MLKKEGKMPRSGKNAYANRAKGKAFRNDFEDMMKLREENKPSSFDQVGGTKQYAETHYYNCKLVPGEATKTLV